MKNLSITLIVCLSLLLGAVTTVATAFAGHATPVPVADCGYTFTTTTRRPTTVGCQVVRRGWPVSFLSGQIHAILQDDRAMLPYQPPMIPAVSDARLQLTPLVADWFGWSAAAGALLGLAAVVRSQLVTAAPKPAARRTK